MSVAEDSKKLVDDLLANTEKARSFTKEQVEEYKKKVNLYGVLVPEEVSYINLSIYNLRDEYYRKLHMTALVGYLFHVLEEYDEYDIDPIKNAFNNETVAKSFIKNEILRFVTRNFNYNPDVHARSAYKENTADPERVGKYDEMRTRMKTEDMTPPNDIDTKALCNDIPRMREYLPEDLRPRTDDILRLVHDADDAAALTYSTALDSADRLNKLNKSITRFRDDTTSYIASLRAGGDPTQIAPPDMDFDDIRTFVASAEDKLLDSAKDMWNLTNSLVKLRDVKGAYTWIPPADIFYHFDRYLTNHYEQLREAAAILYCEKPDIEYAVQYYDWFEDLEQAREHRIKNESRFITDVQTISNEGWTFLGPFKQNRDRLDFYNRNTEILKMIFDQAEQDKKLGAEIMRGRVTKAKTKNILEAGPDDPDLAKYEKAVGTVEALGAKKMLTSQEKAELAEAVQRKEMTEVPPGKIQTYEYKTDSEGNFVKDVVYVDSEDPQPINMTEPKAKKKIKSKKGQIKSLDELSNVIKPKKQSE